MPAETIGEKWVKLEQDSVLGGELGRILTIRIFPESDHDFYLGYENITKRRMLLITVSEENIRRKILPSLKGLDIKIVIFPEDKEGKVKLQISLKDACYKDIFASLTEDIIGHCSSVKSEKAMLKSFFLRFEMWQHFLELHGSEGLSKLEQRGLYGELEFISDFLIPEMGIEYAINSWVGPEKKQQDFQMRNSAVEVKTGLSKQHQKITISSERQLDDTGIKSLFVYFLSLSESNYGTNTLPKIVEDIREKISGSSAELYRFNELLIKAGYLDLHKIKYENTGYALRNEIILEVREGFPRIIEKDLLNGIGDVHYSVSISACSSFCVDRIMLRNKLTEVANER